MNEVINKEFTHLKIHTQYSICEGALRTVELANRADYKLNILDGNITRKNE